MDELLALERQGWQALATAGGAARAFYAGLLREDAAMLFPGGLRIEGRDAILASLDAQPWASFRIEQPRLIELGPAAATLVYGVTAQRPGSPPYRALISSTWVRGPGWRLRFISTRRLEGARKMNRTAYRLAAGLALVGAGLLVWLSLGVGIIGADGDPANRLYLGVIAVGIVGALVSRCRARGMARTLLAMALVQATVAAVAVGAGLGYPYSGPLELILLNGFFVALFAGAAWLFARAAAGRPPARP